MTESRYQRMRICGKTWARVHVQERGRPEAFLWEVASQHLCVLVLNKAEHISQDASVAMVTIRNSTMYI